MSTRICRVCKIEKPLSAFNKNYNKVAKKNYTLKKCKSCVGIDFSKYHREVRRFTKYGLTPEEGQKIVNIAGNKCEICGGTEKIKLRGKTRGLCIDHNHDTGHVRGLLCDRCNQGLGKFQVDSKYVYLLEKAMQYIKRKEQL